MRLRRVLFWAPLLIDAMLKGEFSGIGKGPAAPARVLTPKEQARARPDRAPRVLSGPCCQGFFPVGWRELLCCGRSRFT